MRNNNKTNKRQYLEIANAIVLDNFHIYVEFNDGVCQNIDVGNYMRNNPYIMHNAFLNPEKFKNDFHWNNGNIYWGDNAEMCFHFMSYYYNDLLHERTDYV